MQNTDQTVYPAHANAVSYIDISQSGIEDILTDDKITKVRVYILLQRLLLLLALYGFEVCNTKDINKPGERRIFTHMTRCMTP